VLAFSPLAIFALAVCSAAAGVWLSGLGPASRRLVPFAGGVLMGVAIFWVLPEMAEFFFWPGALAWIGAGAAGLWLIDRYVYPVCTACSPAHDHDHCAARLHGFAIPLLIAAALHSGLDGWSVMASGDHMHFSAALGFGIGAHKIPEGLALGLIARASLPSRFAALRSSRCSRPPSARKGSTSCWRSRAEVFSTSAATPCTGNCAAAGLLPHLCRPSRAWRDQAC
jgi:zinc transporter ZupT